MIQRSVQFSHSVVSNSLWPHGLQDARPPCSSPTPWVYSSLCSLSWWCHPTILSSVFPFSSHLQSFPASGSFQMRQFFTLGGQSTGVSASTSVLPMNTQDLFPLGWPQNWKRSVFIPIPKKGSAKECSNYHTILLIPHTSKVMLKILQARLQQYVNQELPDVQAGFRKGRGTRDSYSQSYGFSSSHV